MITQLTDSPPVFFFDGDCGLCDGFVHFLLSRTPNGSLFFCKLQSPLARHTLSGLGLCATDLRNAYLVHGRHVYAASSAILEALRFVGGPARILRVLRVAPPPIADALYFITARRRKSFSRTCRVLTPAERARFLD